MKTGTDAKTPTLNFERRFVIIEPEREESAAAVFALPLAVAAPSLYPATRTSKDDFLVGFVSSSVNATAGSARLLRTAIMSVWRLLPCDVAPTPVVS
jgi:hypothetical protein